MFKKISQAKNLFSLAKKCIGPKNSILILCDFAAFDTFKYLAYISHFEKNILIMDARVGEYIEPSPEIKQLLYDDKNNIHLANNFSYFLGLILRRKTMELFGKSTLICELLNHMTIRFLSFLKIDFSKIMVAKEIDTIHIMNLHDSIESLMEKDFTMINRVIFTSWGSNLSTQVNSDHKLKLLKKVFAVSTHYAGDTKNDLKLAYELGFKGRTLPFFPFAYYRNINVQKKTIAKHINKILIRADDKDIIYFGIILEVIKKIAAKDFDPHFIFYGIQNIAVVDELNKLIKKSGLKIDYYMKNEIGQEDLKTLFQTSKVFLLLSTHTESIESIFDAIESKNFLILFSNDLVLDLQHQGFSGVLINEMDSNVIADKLSEVLNDISLITNVTTTNLKILEDLFARTTFYDTIGDYYGR